MLLKLTPGSNVGVRILRRHQIQHAQHVVGRFQARKTKTSKELVVVGEDFRPFVFWGGGGKKILCDVLPLTSQHNMVICVL
jgi:hypothetical protein